MRGSTQINRTHSPVRPRAPELVVCLAAGKTKKHNSHLGQGRCKHSSVPPPQWEQDAERPLGFRVVHNPSRC